MMKKYTIFWNPVEHSKSPCIYNKAFEILNINANYNKTNLLEGDILKETFLKESMNWANITVPHKEVAFNFADDVMWLAKKIWAVNTYINVNGKIIAYNTDAPGFMKAIEEFWKIKTALIIWAWWTSKAIAVALKDKGIEVTILNRSEGRLWFFKDLKCKTYTWDNFENNNFDLIINATSAGLSDDNYPAPLGMLKNIIKNSSFCFDCIYNKRTPFLKLASNLDKVYKDWEDMLLYQAVFALEYFIDQKADNDLIDEMRKELRFNC